MGVAAAVEDPEDRHVTDLEVDQDEGGDRDRQGHVPGASHNADGDHAEQRGCRRDPGEHALLAPEDHPRTDEADASEHPGDGLGAAGDADGGDGGGRHPDQGVGPVAGRGAPQLALEPEREAEHEGDGDAGQQPELNGRCGEERRHRLGVDHACARRPGILRPR